MKLYEISDEMVNLLDQVDPETGELPDLTAITTDFKSKSAGVVAYILNLEAVVEKRNELIKKLQKQVKADANKIKGLRNYLQHHMTRTGINLIEANDLSFKAELKYGRDASIEIYDEAQIPAEFLNVKQEITPNKKLIREHIDAGKEVKGARLVRKDRLEIK